MNEQRGFFLVIDGPSGVGKTTVTRLVHEQLAGRGFSVLATKEPSGSPLGMLARTGTDEYQGLSLACLVAADRYYHLEHEVRPALAAGQIVLCDRYVPTSLVLQRIDGLEPPFIWRLNQYADVPDLTIILVGQPARSRSRAERRGIHSRFHRGGTAAGVMEDRLYREVAMQLIQRGQDVFLQDVDDTPPELVAGRVLGAVLNRLERARPKVSTALTRES